MIARAIIIACLALPLAACSANADEMGRVANDFYTAYMSVPHDGIPEADARAKLAPYITRGLENLLEAGENAEARYAKVTHNQSPPIVEGDLFTSLFEGASAFKIGACKAEGDTGRCAVFLTYDDQSGKSQHWTDTALLKHTKDGWRIDDIAYGGQWAFGNKGRLSDTLKFALRAAADTAQ